MLGLAQPQARLAKALVEMQATKSTNEHVLDMTERELEALELKEQDLRKEVERVEEKREWVEEFRGWIELLGEFLEEKVCALYVSISEVSIDSCLLDA